MTGEQFLATHYSVERETFKRKVVSSIMDVYAYYKIQEYKEKQFAPLKKLIIAHLAKIDIGPNPNLIGVSIDELRNNLEQKSQIEILKAVECLKELIEAKREIAQAALGESYTFFKTLQINPYEYHTTVHSPVVGNERERVQQLSKTA